MFRPVPGPPTASVAALFCYVVSCDLHQGHDDDHDDDGHPGHIGLIPVMAVPALPGAMNS